VNLGLALPLVTTCTSNNNFPLWLLTYAAASALLPASTQTKRPRGTGAQYNHCHWEEKQALTAFAPVTAGVVGHDDGVGALMDG
jgi:hypothetical protein